VSPVSTDPALLALVAPGAEFELLGDGFGFCEGPVWRGATSDLLFTDMPGDVIRRWTPAGGFEPWKTAASMPNGQTLDPSGEVITCNHYPPEVVRNFEDGRTEVLASHWDGLELNSPNDVICRSDGSIYFTDPPSGRTKEWGVERPMDLDFMGVYLIRPDGELVLLIDDFILPNGLALSPDESILYVNDTTWGLIRAYDVAADGTVSDGRLLIDGMVTGNIPDGVPDGMKCDVDGNVYCTGPGGIWVVAPTGDLIGVIEAPVYDGVREAMINFNWGGDDFSDLYICGITRVFRLRMAVRGAGLPGKFVG
jgi:gluconolactonase